MARLSTRIMLGALMMSAVTMSVAGSAMSADLNGTSGSDVFFFQGNLNPTTNTFVSPTGISVHIDSEFNVNNKTYDGLGGTDTLLMTNYADFLLSSDVTSVEVFYAGDGADFIDLNSQPNALHIDLGGGNDFGFGGLSNDTINGYTGDDFIDAGPGNDVVNGGDGNDTLVASLGNDTFNGGAGTDTILFNPSVVLSDIQSASYSSLNDLLTVSLINFDGSDSQFTGRSIEFLDLGGTLFSPSAFVSAVTVSPVPLPATLPLFLTMLAGIGALRGWRRRVA